MESHQAILAFSQSEKIKSGIIWVSQLLQTVSGYSEAERTTLDGLLQHLTAMVTNEVSLAGRIAENDVWSEVEKCLETALVMIRSGVSQEAAFHLTQALSHVTGIGQQSMMALKDKELLQ
ncbi:MAG: hypothetical protein HKM93_04790 [Desulfobacteraceae bacterium]|nr:hypothetical protein [Desulfobacteraceae bacterium]